MTDRRPDLTDRDPYAVGYWAGARAEAEMRDATFRGFGLEVINCIEALAGAERRADPHAGRSDKDVAKSVAEIWLEPRDLLRLTWVLYRRRRRFRA